MESSTENSMSSTVSVATNYEMDTSNEDIDQQVLREAGEQTISAEWSATVSALNSSDTTSSNSYINIETLKECCANPSDTLKDKEDFMVFESSSTVVNISKFNANDTKYYSERKTTAFQKKHKPFSQNVSHYFENVLNDDSQMEITQNSICLNRFQKRKRLIPPNDEDFIEINNSNFNGSNSVDVSMMKSPKFCFSRKTIDVADSVFDNITNDSSIISNITLNNKNASPTKILVSNADDPVFNKIDMTSLNHTYDIPTNIDISTVGDTNLSKVKQNIDFKNPVNSSLVINNSSNNIIDASKTEVLRHKFSRKTIDVADSGFDNIINDSSITSEMALNNKNASPTKILVSNADDPVLKKIDMTSLNHTYDIPTNIDVSTVGNTNLSNVKQNIDFKNPINSSLVIKNSSNNIIDASKTEVLRHKFSRKTIDVNHSVFDNIINDSSITSEMALNNKKVSLIETSASNINNTPVFSTMDVSNLNHTYDVPKNNNTTLLDTIVEHDKSISETPVLLQNNRSKSFNLLPLKFNFSNKFGRHSLSLQENCPSFDVAKKHNISLNTDFIKNPGVESNSIHKSANNSNLNLKLHPHISVIQENNSSPEIQPLDDDSLPTNKLNQEQFQPNHSLSSTSTNEGLTLINSTSELLGSCSSSRSQSSLLTSKQSNSSTSNSDSLNSTMESLDSNESKNDQSKRSISSTSSNEGLTLINSTTGFSRNHSSSRNRSISSKCSNDDSLILLNTTTDSLKSNESLKTQSKRSICPSSFNKSLTFTNSTTRLSGRNSSKNKSTASKHSTSVISNNKSVTSLNNSTEKSVGSCSSRNKSLSISSKHSNSDNLLLLNASIESLKNNESKNKSTASKHSTSVISNNESVTSLNNSTEKSVGSCSSRNKSLSTSSKHSNSDNLLLLNTSIESLKNNESQKIQSKRSISPTSYNESLKSTNSIKEYSGKRSLSRSKSTSSNHSTSVISNSESLTLLNDCTETSVGSCSSRNKSLPTSSKHSTSVNSNGDNLLLLSDSIESLKNNESQRTQSKRSISPTSYNESLKSTNSIKEYSGKRSLSRSKSTSSEHSSSVISNNERLTSLNDSTEISVGSSSRNKSSTSSKHLTSVISNGDNLLLLNASIESLKNNESQKIQSKRSISPTSYNESLKSTNSTAEFSGRRRSSRNKSISSKHSTSVISNNEKLPLLNAATVESIKNNESQKMHSKRSINLNSSKEIMKSTNSTVGISGKRSSSRNKSSLLTSKHSTSVVSNNDSLTSLNSTTAISVGSRLSRNETQHSTSVILNNDSLPLVNASTIGTLESNKSLKTRSTSPTSDIENLTTFNTTTGSLKQNALSINRSNSKHSSSDITQKTSINVLMSDDAINNVSRMSTRSSKQKNNCSGNLESVTYDDIKRIKPNNNNYGPLLETRVLRSSLRINKNKSLLTKSLTTESNVNNLSIGSTRTSKNIINSDDSLFWTTLPDDSTNISSTQNINMDTFQTPKRNKISIAENIVKTIKIMSTNKKSTHPGAFELDDHNDRPTRSFVTRSYNRSPSILTLVFGGQKTSESTSSLIQSPPEIIFDQSRVEENVKQKFKSLYKKEPWITKRLYKFLIIKLQPNYNIYSVKYAEKFVKYLAQLFKQIYNDQVNLQLCTDMLRYHMARYHIIKDTFDYLEFLTDYIPMVYYKKLVPGWNLETSAIKFDPQKYYIPLMDDEEFLNYIMEHLNEA